MLPVPKSEEPPGSGTEKRSDIARLEYVQMFNVFLLQVDAPSCELPVPDAPIKQIARPTTHRISPRGLVFVLYQSVGDRRQWCP